MCPLTPQGWEHWASRTASPPTAKFLPGLVQQGFQIHWWLNQYRMVIGLPWTCLTKMHLVYTSYIRSFPFLLNPNILRRYALFFETRSRPQGSFHGKPPDPRALPASWLSSARGSRKTPAGNLCTSPPWLVVKTLVSRVFPTKTHPDANERTREESNVQRQAVKAWTDFASYATPIGQLVLYTSWSESLTWQNGASTSGQIIDETASKCLKYPSAKRHILATRLKDCFPDLSLASTLGLTPKTNAMIWWEHLGTRSEND